MNHVPGGPDRGPDAAGPDAGADQDEAGDVDHVVEEGTPIGMHPEGTPTFFSVCLTTLYENLTPHSKVGF